MRTLPSRRTADVFYPGLARGARSSRFVLPGGRAAQHGLARSSREAARQALQRAIGTGMPVARPGTARLSGAAEALDRAYDVYAARWRRSGGRGDDRGGVAGVYRPDADA